jgi:hypothetical protein
MSDHERWAWRPQEGRSRRWYGRTERLPQWARVRGLAGSGSLASFKPAGLAEHVRMNATEAEPGPSCKISYLLRLRRLRPLRPRKGGQCAVRCSG